MDPNANCLTCGGIKYLNEEHKCDAKQEINMGYISDANFEHYAKAERKHKLFELYLMCLSKTTQESIRFEGFNAYSALEDAKRLLKYFEENWEK